MPDTQAEGCLMQMRTLGESELEVSGIGLGCMGMSFSYGPSNDKYEMISLLHAAGKQGVTFCDTVECMARSSKKNWWAKRSRRSAGSGAVYSSNPGRLLQADAQPVDTKNFLVELKRRNVS